MRLLKLTFVETKDIPDGVIRSYEADFKQRHVDEFVSATDTGHRLTAAKLARVTSDFLTPSTDRRISSSIEGGWDSNRLMFAMVVEVASEDRYNTYEYIVGFTDHAGYSTLSGKNVKFAEDMKMYFNSITRVHLCESEYRDNRVWQPRIQAHDQILHRSALGDKTASRRAATLRPTDLFTRAGSETGFGSLIRKHRDSGVTVRNTTGGFVTPLKANDRQNNCPVLHLGRSISSYIKSASDPSGTYIGDYDQDEVVKKAGDLVDENILEEDPYLEEIKKDHNILRSGYITYGELLDDNPDFDESRVPFAPLKTRKNWRASENYASWNSDSTETIAATIIAHSIPVFMLQAMYSKVDNLIINTRARIGEDKVIAAFPTPFVEGMTVKSNLTYFESQIEDVLLPCVTKNGLFDIEAKIKANIDGEMEIWISVDDDEEKYFIFPAFADSMLSPTLVDDVQSVDKLSNSIVRLSEGLTAKKADDSPNHTRSPGIVLNADRPLSVEREESRRRDSRRDRDDEDRGW